MCIEIFFIFYSPFSSRVQVGYAAPLKIKELCQLCDLIISTTGFFYSSHFPWQQRSHKVKTVFRATITSCPFSASGGMGQGVRKKVQTGLSGGKKTISDCQGNPHRYWITLILFCSVITDSDFSFLYSPLLKGLVILTLFKLIWKHSELKVYGCKSCVKKYIGWFQQYNMYILIHDSDKGDILGQDLSKEDLRMHWGAGLSLLNSSNNSSL